MGNLAENFKFRQSFPAPLVFRLSRFNAAIFQADNFCNCLNRSCASFGEKKNEIGCVVFALISINWHFLGLEKIDLPLKSPRNKIIQILFQQC